MIRWLQSLFRPKAAGGYTAVLDTTRPLPLLGQPIQLDNVVRVQVQDPLPGLIEDTLRKYRPVIHLCRRYLYDPRYQDFTAPAWAALPSSEFQPRDMGEYYLCPIQIDPLDAYCSRLDRLLERDGYDRGYRRAVLKHLRERRMRKVEDKQWDDASTEEAMRAGRRKLLEVAELLKDPKVETQEEFNARMTAIRLAHTRVIHESTYRNRGQWPAR